MRKIAFAAICAGLILRELQRRRAKRSDKASDWKRVWEEEAELLGLPKSTPAEPCRPIFDEQGRQIVLTLYGPATLHPGESPNDPKVLERANEAAEARRVTAFYEEIRREREKCIPPGSRLKRDRWGFLFERNPNGLGWREFGSDPDEPYEIRINSSW